MAKTKRKSSVKKKRTSVSRQKKVVRKSRPKVVRKTHLKQLKTKKPAAKPRVIKEQKQTIKPARKDILGEITHFYDHISVAVVKLHNTLRTGDIIHIEGHGKSFNQKVTSIQMEHKQLSEAKKGMEIGLKVDAPVKAKDLVYKK